MKNAKPQKKAKIMPLGDKVLVRPIEEVKEEKTKSGIFLPDSMKKEGRYMRGEVIAVGRGWYQNGELIPLQVEVGDKVIFSKYDGDEIEIDDKKYMIIKEDNISAIIN